VGSSFDSEVTTDGPWFSESPSDLGSDTDITDIDLEDQEASITKSSHIQQDSHQEDLQMGPSGRDYKLCGAF
jgi:hypothetical protein